MELFQKDPKLQLVTISGSPGIGKSLFYMYCFHLFRSLTNFKIITAAFDKSGEIDKNNILLWTHGADEPTEITEGSFDFNNCIHDTKTIKLFDGPSPIMNIQVRPSLVFNHPTLDTSMRSETLLIK